MSEPDGQADPSTTAPARPPVRIGTAERNAALQALDAHLEAGRLDAMEYGERSATVAEARTADEISPLFADLPAPHPDLPVAAGAPVAPGPAADPVTTPAGPPATRPSGGMEVWGPRVAGVMPFVALALFLLVPGHIWLFFLLVPAAGVLFAGSRDDRRARRDDRREEHRRRHDERHGRW